MVIAVSPGLTGRLGIVAHKAFGLKRRISGGGPELAFVLSGADAPRSRRSFARNAVHADYRFAALCSSGKMNARFIPLPIKYALAVASLPAGRISLITIFSLLSSASRIRQIVSKS